jgi:hypothetical protein
MALLAGHLSTLHDPHSERSKPATAFIWQRRDSSTVVLGHTEEGLPSDDEQTPRSLREVEAESVALLCIARIGRRRICTRLHSELVSWSQYPGEIGTKDFRHRRRDP